MSQITFKGTKRFAPKPLSVMYIILHVNGHPLSIQHVNTFTCEHTRAAYPRENHSLWDDIVRLDLVFDPQNVHKLLFIFFLSSNQRIYTHDITPTSTLSMTPFNEASRFVCVCVCVLMFTFNKRRYGCKTFQSFLYFTYVDNTTALHHLAHIHNIYCYICLVNTSDGSQTETGRVLQSASFLKILDKLTNRVM